VDLAPRQPVPVFPLPDLVLFPCAVVKLHVFELRYRAMVRDALSADRLIALALLLPGWERDYHGSPEYHPIGCLARLDVVDWRPDDCYDLWVTGLSRVRFERPSREYPYRAARVSLVRQEPLDDDDPLVQMERRTLEDAYRRLPEARWISLDPRGTLHDAEKRSSFEGYVNAVCLGLPLTPREKLELLELDSVLERSRRARERIEAALRRPQVKREGDQN